MARIAVRRLNGNEEFRDETGGRVATVREFWQWACSELGGNTMRGRVAEFLVARALNLDGGYRSEWTAADLVTPGGQEIEVKSASYAQVWTQRVPGALSFGIAPTHRWDAQSGATDPVARRQAALYVFAVLGRAEQPTTDPLLIADWEFLLLPTARIDAALGDQKSARLSSLLKLAPVRVGYGSLADALTRMLAEMGR